VLQPLFEAEIAQVVGTDIIGRDERTDDIELGSGTGSLLYPGIRGWRRKKDVAFTLQPWFLQCDLEGRSGMTRIAEHEAETVDRSVSLEEQVEKVRRRAYELYEARGREDGHDVEDWLQAEAEVAAAESLAADL
jgi:hypothetical protein